MKKLECGEQGEIFELRRLSFLATHFPSYVFMLPVKGIKNNASL